MRRTSVRSAAAAQVAPPNPSQSGPLKTPTRLSPVKSESRASLLPRARVLDVLFGKSRFIGSRCQADAPRGFISPAEARVLLGIDYDDAVTIEKNYRPSFGNNIGTAGRATIARCLSVGGSGVRERRPFIVSARVDAISISDAAEAILTPLADRAKIILFAHPHALNLAYFDPALSKRMHRADLVLPDGVGIRIAARMLGRMLPNNVNGTDMLPVLCSGAVERGLPLVLVGGKPGVAKTCAERLQQGTPGLKIPIVSDGYLGENESHRLVEQIRSIGPCMVLVGMGTPLQEAWAWNYLADLPGVSAVTVGGLFDFFAGRMERAPMAWREMGLEWLFRLIQEPRRMARRYLVGNPLFISLALMQRFRSRASARATGA